MEKTYKNRKVYKDLLTQYSMKRLLLIYPEHKHRALANSKEEMRKDLKIGVLTWEDFFTLVVERGCKKWKKHIK